MTPPNKVRQPQTDQPEERTMAMCKSFGSVTPGGSIAVLVAVFFTIAAANAVTATATYTRTPRPSAAETQPDVFRAIGEGAMATAAEEPNRAKAYLKAKAYAKLEAVANLMQATGGTLVEYCSTGSDYIAEEQISQKIDGLLGSVRIVSERKRQEGKDTIVQVTVQAASFDLWRAAQPKMAAQDDSPARPVQVASAAWSGPLPANVGRCAKEAPYTAVIINAKGFNVARSMAPKILRPDGSEVWGTLKVSYDFVAEHGIAAYARSLGEAYGNSRAGDNPLVIRAVGRGAAPYGGDVVISSEDADYLLAQTRRVDFLSAFRVLFVIDPSPF